MAEPMAALTKNRAKSSGQPGRPTAATWWRHLFVESDDVQLVCDRHGVVWTANRKAEEQFGLFPKQCLFEGGLLAAEAAEELRQGLARKIGRASCREGA